MIVGSGSGTVGRKFSTQKRKKMINSMFLRVERSFEGKRLTLKLGSPSMEP
jgi:hypothetical protein